MMVLSLFIIDLMGLFFYTKIGSIISIGDLPTTNIIEPEICPFFFDVQSDKNPFFEVFKVPKTKGIALDKFDKIIGCFQFGVWIGELKSVDDFLFIFEESFKDSLKKRMNLLKIVFNESEKFLRFLILKVKKQELIDIVVVF